VRPSRRHRFSYHAQSHHWATLSIPAADNNWANTSTIALHPNKLKRESKPSSSMLNRSRRLKVSEEPGRENHSLPCLPLPAVWWCVKTTVLSGAPASAKAKQISLVEPASSRIWRVKPGGTCIAIKKQNFLAPKSKYGCLPDKSHRPRFYPHGL